MDVLEETMNESLPDPSDECYGRVLSARKDAAVSVLNTALKADENRFRVKKNDLLKNLFEKMEKEKLLIVN
jgi:hypothetical protein